MRYKFLMCVVILCLMLNSFNVSIVAELAADNSEHFLKNEELAGSTNEELYSSNTEADGFVEIKQIDGHHNRTSTTYYIAEMNNGYMLTSPSSGTFSKTLYHSGDSTSHYYQKWIFTDTADGYYTVYSNTDPSKCLTVNPSTKAVTLSAYSGSQYQKWKMYYASGGNALQCVSSDSSVNGSKLVINWTSCQVSNSTYTPVGFIDVTWYVPCTAISIRDMAVAIGENYSSYTPTYTPTNSNCNGNNWLTYASSNTTVCTINSSGIVSGLSLGVSTITVTNKITRVSGSFTVCVLPLVTYDARLFYDSGTTQSASTLELVYKSAIKDIRRAYCIEFNLMSTAESSLLNGNSCPNTTSSNICNSTCGSVSSCSSLHHKSASRLLSLLQNNGYYTYRLVSHAICTYSDSSHYGIVGLGYRPGKNAITSLESTPNLTRSIQHELTHNLGGSHDTCISTQKCVLHGDYGYWCDNCRAAILDGRS